MQPRKILFAALTFALLAAVSGVSARADGLLLTLSDPNQNIAYNSTATFNGTLTNDSLVTLNIGTPGFTLPGQRVPFSYEVTILSNSCPNCSNLIRYGLTSSDNPLIPTSLASMATTGDIRLFDISFGHNNQPFTVTGLFTVHYYVNGTSGPVQSVSANFSVDVGAVPEPATMILLGTGLAGVAARTYKRRRAPLAQR